MPASSNMKNRFTDASSRFLSRARGSLVTVCAAFSEVKQCIAHVSPTGGTFGLPMLPDRVHNTAGRNGVAAAVDEGDSQASVGPRRFHRSVFLQRLELRPRVCTWITRFIVIVTAVIAAGVLDPSAAPVAAAGSSAAAGAPMLPNGWVLEPAHGMTRETDTMPQG